MADQTPKLTPSQLHGLLAAGGSRVTRVLRAWEPPGAEVIQQALPQYEITAFIARGGMGAVYKGVQRALGRTVAIKILPPDIVDDELGYAARFKQEARAMAALSHPNIVAVHEAGEVEVGRADGPPSAVGGDSRRTGDSPPYPADPSGKLLYFVMEFVEGTDLAQLVLSEGRLDTTQVLDITRQVCEALAFAHAGGIVHRDIKPSNIMIDKSGRVKVADFGLAKLDLPEGASQLTGGGLALGTPDYMAPEALTSLMPVDQRADLYAVGVMLYQMLTGDVPRGRFPLPSVVVPGIDARLDAIVDKAMQTDREQRYSSAVEMREDVESVTRSGGLPPPGRGMTAIANRRSLIFALVAVLAIGFGGWWMLKRPSNTNAAPQGPHWSQMPTEEEKKLAFTNTLGMKFIPVPGTEVLFCIHETRRGDYAAYAAANPGLNDDWMVKLDYPGGKVSTADDHPVVRINTADAQGFCAWLSAKEGRRYRLPTDHEWSCAAGIGEREDARDLPINKANHLKGIYVWGLDWPPPAGAGNVGDESLRRMNGQKIETDGYDDGYGTTAPVMSFKPNALGIHDLVGNVWERCADWFDTTHTRHLGRGESFNNAERNYLHASVRNSIKPETRQENYGFRVVVEKP